MDPLLVTVLVLVAALLGVAAGVGFFVRGRSKWRPDDVEEAQPGPDYAPGVGDDASEPRDTAVRTVDSIELPDEETGPSGPG